MSGDRDRVAHCQLVVLFALAGVLGGACSKSSPAASPGVAYEVFVRSFADSDGDGIGDLKGLTAHLDYLNDGDPRTTTDLGVDVVWLMPIHPSPSYHGYDVADYRKVNARYGTLADFDAFVAAAHRRGIKVLLDMVLNHTSQLHAWFADSSQGAASPMRGWYEWRDSDPQWFGQRGSLWAQASSGWYYAYFSPAMPDLNLANPAVEAELLDTMKFWLSHGVDGFRLDAVRYFFENGPQAITDQPETHAFLARLRAALESVRPGVLLVAEAWANVNVEATYYGHGDEAHLAFAFDQAASLLDSARTGQRDALVNQLARTESAFAGKDRAFEAPFLSNHDQVRTMRALGADAGAARVAAAAMMAMPGTPFIYYGEELGMQGGGGTGDEDKRTPFHWTAAAPGYGFSTATPWNQSTDEAPGTDVASQAADPGSLWNLYRRLIGVRHANPALGAGSATRVDGAGAPVFALVRELNGQRVLFVANFAATASGPFSVKISGRPTVLESEGVLAAPAQGSAETDFSGLQGRGFAFVSLD